MQKATSHALLLGMQWAEKYGEKKKYVMLSDSPMK
jgi:hypothetical protein